MKPMHFGLSRVTRYMKRPTFRSHVAAHEAVISNEAWYGDNSPLLGPAFTARKTAERQQAMIEVLWRAAKRATRAGKKTQAEAYGDLGDKLDRCQPRQRCGSLACLMCLRAFQKAKVAAKEISINELAKRQAKKQLVLVTLIPKALMFSPGQFATMNIKKANRWLKDALTQAGINRVVVGSADLSWESRRGPNYLQLHWHLAMWTSNPAKLRRKLRKIFVGVRKHERPIDVAKSEDLGFLAYVNKVLKWPDLLRRARRELPELLRALDQIEPLELLVLRKLRVRAKAGGIAIVKLRSGENWVRNEKKRKSAN
jgi:hypothetical protein